MDESLFSVRGKKTLIQRERERERESVGESSKELKSPEHMLQEVVEHVPRDVFRILVVVVH